MTTDERPVLAVDVGGTKLAVALVDRNGRVHHAVRTATPHGPRADAERVWRALDGVVDRVLAQAGPDGVAGAGVGCGGPMRWPDGVVSPLNLPAWADFPLRARLGERLAGRPVRVHNDAVCVAVAEHWLGAGRGAEHVLGMVVSTGVGGGLVLGGRTVDGAHGNAGHIGHVVVDPDGGPCECGGRGCLESVASGPSLARWAQEQGWRPTVHLAAQATARELAVDARRGHPVALAAMGRAGHALGVGIASATHLLDLEVVSVGGGLAQAGPLLFAPLEEAFRRHARLPFAQDVRVVPAALGQDAGLVGAAALVLAGERYWNPERRHTRTRSR
ncbi:MAG: ROK family protein [Actinomycetia bacterium]|nr:ROK family protein [Actinomycetes bacterium]